VLQSERVLRIRFGKSTVTPSVMVLAPTSKVGSVTSPYARSAVTAGFSRIGRS
jgi:hypothetical protein